MRLALVHARRVAVEPGAPAVADPAPGEPVERTDCLLALAGVEPEDPPEALCAEEIEAAADDLRCASVVLVFCPALVAATADRRDAGAVLRAVADGVGLDAVVAPSDRYPALDVETAGHPSAVRVLRPEEGERARRPFDPSPLADAGLAESGSGGFRWTPAGVVARRALLAGVAERFARAGADPVDPPLLPDREGTPEAAPDALRLADPPLLLRPRATFGVVPDTSAVYATGPAVRSGAGVYRPEALDPDVESLRRWLALTDETLRGLGFDPDVQVRASEPAHADAARDALGDVPLDAGAETTRVAFHTAGPTGVVELADGVVRCAPIGSARRTLGALGAALPVALAPTQLRLVPIDGELERCRSLAADFAVRADVDDRPVPTGERLADAKRVPFTAVVGPGDADLPVAGPDGSEVRLTADAVDAHVRDVIGEPYWPPVPARRPVSLGARRR